MHSDTANIPVIAGPTAVGKTSVSVRVARTLLSEIISVDSRQVFREMRIGTARPSDGDMQSVRHHFVADRNLNESFSAGIFAREAEKRIGTILQNDCPPLVVGGATLYLKALTDGLADIPSVDPEIRDELNRRLESEGSEILFQELCKIDPPYALTLDSSKSQRIVRGLEVWTGTGKRLSEYISVKSNPRFTYTIFVLDRDRTELYDRINRRVLSMVEAGLIEEVQAILAKGIDPEINALRTIGYREVVRHLNGECTEKEMISDLQKNSRRYAKRQLTWFRRISGARWINLTGRSDEEAANVIIAGIRSRSTEPAISDPAE